MTAREAALADALRSRALREHEFMHNWERAPWEGCGFLVCVDARALLAEAEGAPLTAERLARALHVVDHPADDDCVLGRGTLVDGKPPEWAGRRYCEVKAEAVLAALRDAS